MKEYFNTQIKPIADKIKELLEEKNDPADSFIQWIREREMNNGTTNS